MLTVAEGVVLGALVIEAHPAMRRNVMPAKVELMKLVFMVSRFLIGFYRVDVDNTFLTNASEGNAGGDLRAVHGGVEKEAVVVVVNRQGPVTDLSEDGTSEVDTDHPFDLPH